MVAKAESGKRAASGEADAADAKRPKVSRDELTDPDARPPAITGWRVPFPEKVRCYF